MKKTENNRKQQKSMKQQTKLQNILYLQQSVLLILNNTTKIPQKNENKKIQKTQNTIKK